MHSLIPMTCLLWLFGFYISPNTDFFSVVFKCLPVLGNSGSNKCEYSVTPEVGGSVAITNSSYCVEPVTTGYNQYRW